MTTLKAGGEKLYNGTQELANGTSALKDGTTTLYDGSNKLVDGIIEFNNSGISKIYNLVNNDVRKTINRIDEMQNLVDDFNKYSSDEEREAIKYIYMIDSLNQSKQEETHEEIILNNEETNRKK